MSLGKRDIFLKYLDDVEHLLYVDKVSKNRKFKFFLNQFFNEMFIKVEGSLGLVTNDHKILCNRCYVQVHIKLPVANDKIGTHKTRILILLIFPIRSGLLRHESLARVIGQALPVFDIKFTFTFTFLITPRCSVMTSDESIAWHKVSTPIQFEN